jgi:predicted esterase
MNGLDRSRELLFAGMLLVHAGACGDSGPNTGRSTSGSPTGGSLAAGSGQTATGGTPGSGGISGLTGGTANAGGSSASGGSSNGGVSATGGTLAGSEGAGVAGGGQAGGAAQSGAGGGAGHESGGSGGSGQAGRGTGSGGQGGTAGRSISFGTLLDAEAVMSSARELARSLSDPNSSEWRKKGDQHRTYRFAEASSDAPYRLYVPSDWDGSTTLPLAMFLHGAGSNENTYVDQNNRQMLSLAEQHGYLLVSPLGDRGAYGNFLRLTAPFGDEAGAAELMAQVTEESERTNQLSEKDVINVLELVLNEYPVDRAAMFLFGHSMGSGGTWYIGGKYAGYWKGIAPMSGPFVQKTGYPWEGVRNLSIFVTEGTQTPSLEASRLLRDWLEQDGFQSQYEEVDADHGGMVRLVLPDIFEFFDGARAN